MATAREAALQTAVVAVVAAGIGLSVAVAPEDPVWALHESLLTNQSTSWAGAKQDIYNEIDLDGDSVVCVYSGTVVELEKDDGTFRPDLSVQVEHTWASSAAWTDLHFPRSSLPGADLHHLFPARAGLNGSRSNLAFGVPVTNRVEKRINITTGQLDDNGHRTGCFRGQNAAGDTVWEVRLEHRGNVARAMFYMSVRYWWEIPLDMEEVLKDWHEEDPVDADERARNELVQDIQGNLNPFIVDPGLVDLIRDF